MHYLFRDDDGFIHIAHAGALTSIGIRREGTNDYVIAVEVSGSSRAVNLAHGPRALLSRVLVRMWDRMRKVRRGADIQAINLGGLLKLARDDAPPGEAEAAEALTHAPNVNAPPRAALDAERINIELHCLLAAEQEEGQRAKALRRELAACLKLLPPMMRIMIKDQGEDLLQLIDREALLEPLAMEPDVLLSRAVSESLASRDFTRALGLMRHKGALTGAARARGRFEAWGALGFFSVAALFHRYAADLLAEALDPNHP